jgi:trk system potassium uptake protein
VKAVIVGCGRVGSVLADAFDRAGQDVIIIDTSTSAFDRLPSMFGGTAVRGDGTDEDTLRRAGAESADLFMAMTEGDNRNALAAQLGKHSFGVPRVIAKINDPLRAEAYRALGLETICRTVILADALVEAAEHGFEASADSFVQAATAEPLRGAPPAGTQAEDHAQAAIAAERDQTPAAE